jgi:hypothetical protein
MKCIKIIEKTIEMIKLDTALCKLHLKVLRPQINANIQEWILSNFMTL